MIAFECVFHPKNIGLLVGWVQHQWKIQQCFQAWALHRRFRRDITGRRPVADATYLPNYLLGVFSLLHLLPLMSYIAISRMSARTAPRNFERG